MIRYGVARRNITPKWPVLMGGFAYRNQRSNGVHDPIEAKCVSLGDGRTRIVIVACDLLWVEAETCRAVRHAIAEEHGLSGHHLMIVGTHTHAAPTELGTARGRQAGEAEHAYWQYVRERIVEAIGEAMSYESPGTLEWAESVTNIGVNRRRMSSNGVTIAPNRQGIVNRNLGVLAVRSARGRLDAILANAACHPTILHANNLSISAEFPGVACRLIESEYPGATAVFLQGACADVEPVVCDVGVEFKGERGSFRDVDVAGYTLAHEVLFAVGDAEALASDALGATSELLTLQCRVRTDERYYRAEMVGLDRGDYVWDWCDERLSELRRGESPIPEVRAEIQVFSIGSGLRIVGVEGEVFSDTAARIRSACAGKRTLIAGYANGCVGYIPTADAAREGGYEVDRSAMYYRLPGPFLDDSEERLLDVVAASCR